MTCAITAALSLTLGAAGLAQAGRQGDTVGQPWIGQNGITETVNQIMAREAGLAPLRNLMPRPADPLVVENREGLPENPASPETSQWPVPVGGPQPIISGSFTRGAGKTGGRRTYNPQPVGVTFLGAQQSESPYVPPDSMGAVSPTQVLFCENGRIKVFSKAGVLGALNASTDTFFSSVLGGSSASDPRVRFDRLSQRWFITMINVTTPNRVMIAVSSGATITG
ncbi:MAG TPA: hypothetical protein VGS41_14160, partial [Chthonomonadales bacterium]|nr:hypothetical protein [Chthonomonadales bacterium]